MAVIRALQVGINSYKRVPLAGCLNDVENFHEQLKSRFPNNLDRKALTESEATYENVIKMFREHLGKGEAGDVAVFHYCGHGSREAAAAEFLDFSGEPQNEGLVCYDSRDEGRYLLADKELAVLIAELAAKQMHVCVILDCCHSGSGTRDADSFQGTVCRSLPATDDPPRPLESYIDGYYAKLEKGNFSIPRSPHMLLAACDRLQTAGESQVTHKGYFTTALVEALGDAGAPISYSDLFVRCRAAVRAISTTQDPQFEPVGGFAASSGFLGCEVGASKAPYFVHYQEAPTPAPGATPTPDPGWLADCGAIDGLPTDAQTPATFNLYAAGALDIPAGTARATRVGPQQCTLQLADGFQPDPAGQYWAEITSLASPPLFIGFDGAAEDRATVEAALKGGAIDVSLTAALDGMTYSLSMGGDGLSLRQHETGTLIQIARLGADGLAGAAERLRPAVFAIAAWERTLALENRSTTMDPAKVEFTLLQQSPTGELRPMAGNDVSLDYAPAGDERLLLRARFQVVNRTDQPLYVTLLHFSQQYGIDQVYTDRVPNGPPVTLWGDAATTGFWLGNGENTALERFKLVVSTEPVDSYLLEQKGLDIGAVLEPTRGFGAFDAPQADKLFAQEWFTKDFRVSVVRRLGGVGASVVNLAENQIRILPHPTVTADVKLGAARQATRGEADASDFYRTLERTGLRLIDFSAAYGDAQRSTEPFNDLSILEFSDIRNADALAQTPLRIEIRTPLGPNEAIVPLVFDGTHVQVAGLFGPQDDGSTLVEIDQLPAAEVTQRGLGGTLKLYLFKALLKQADVNRLQWVDFGDASKPPVLSDSMMGAKTGPAKTVLLLLHGLVDSSSDMIAGVQATGLAAEFDLVLVYTYESLKTPIEDTSGKLQAALAGAGIGPSDGKRLTVLAHGMGGLVARHFVELGEGKDVVDHLVMCGTPNQGSPFGEVDAARKLLTFMLTLAQNYIPGAGAYLLPVLTVLKASADMTQTLAEMKPDSALLKALSKAPDPGVSYTILAGNIDAYQEPSDAHFPDLLNRLGKAELFKLLFADKQNDLAASVDSIGGGRKRIDVACYYLNYFTSPAGREALKAVDW